MKPIRRKLTVKKLLRPEYHGDWHDKPVKWISVCGSDALFTQKFATKRLAVRWASIARRSLTFREAFLAL